MNNVLAGAAMAAVTAYWLLMIVHVFVGNPCIGHRWEQWSSYTVVQKTDHVDGRLSPPPVYKQTERTDFWQKRECKRCGREERRLVA